MVLGKSKRNMLQLSALGIYALKIFPESRSKISTSRLISKFAMKLRPSLNVSRKMNSHELAELLWGIELPVEKTFVSYPAAKFLQSLKLNSVAIVARMLLEVEH